MKCTRQIPDSMAKVTHGLMSEWKVLQLIVKIEVKHRSAPEGTWVPIGGIQISCFYFLYGVKFHKSSLWEKIK